ncbi:MAG: acetylglutamate kinase [Elusimicrobiota bacterium]
MKSKNLIVIKYGGSLMDNKSAEKKILKTINKFAEKKSVIVVHGGGKEITIALKKSKIETKFINGLRYTNKKSIKIVEKVLENIQKRIAKKIKNAVATKKVIVGKRIKKLGYVGKFVFINSPKIKKYLSKNKTIILSSVGQTKTGQILNLNADEVASGCASFLKAEKLIFFTDVKGVLDNDEKTIPVIKIKNIKNLIKKGIITGGMIPKIIGCAQAVKKGVKEVDIVNTNLEGTKIFA